MPVNASFEIGSVTKQFTGVAVMQLAEKGLLNPEDDITAYIDFDTKGRNVTIEQLLNHTSGIKSYTSLPSFNYLQLHEYPKDTILRLTEKEPFDFEPGTAMIYNNTGFFMLGRIIEKVSAKTFEEYVSENLFKPAGMQNSYYCDERTPIENKAYGYDKEDDELIKAGYLDHTWPYAAGSLCSTVEDLLKWNHVLHETNILLSQESYRKFITTSRLNDGTPLRYATGIVINPYKGNRALYHGGGINGFLSDARYFPDQKIAVITLINTTGGLAPPDVSNTIADMLLPLKDTLETKNYPGNLSELEGMYKGRGRGVKLTLVIEATDSLLTSFARGKKDTLQYTGNNRWVNNDQYYTFEKVDGTKLLHMDQPYGHFILEHQ